MEQALVRHDTFFTKVINAIPPAQYLRTDEDEAARASSNSKYQKHKKKQAKNNIAKQKRIENLEAKRRKFKPELESTNVEAQAAIAAKEASTNTEMKKSKGNIAELRERLQAKISALKGNRSVCDKEQKPVKKRKREEEKKQVIVPEDISYGSLLVGGEEESKPVKKSGIKNLLKQAEANQKKMEELKKTEAGQALVKAKGLSTAIKQASGEKVMDDPKLLRKALKKKEKLKRKSAKEWNSRVAEVNKAKKEKIKQGVAKRRAAGRSRTKKNSGDKRAGFEGKKGEKSFLNAKKK